MEKEKERKLEEERSNEGRTQKLISISTACYDTPVSRAACGAMLSDTWVVSGSDWVSGNMSIRTSRPSSAR